jgi:hypothetical protein
MVWVEPNKFVHLTLFYFKSFFFFFSYFMSPFVFVFTDEGGLHKIKGLFPFKLMFLDKTRSRLGDNFKSWMDEF